MAKFDAENLLASVLAIMTHASTGLNVKIAEIEAEKNAAGATLTPALATIDSGSYHEQTWSNKILQTTPAIFYGIEDVQAVDGGGALAKTYKVFCEVVMVDNGNTNDVHKRILRYSRALEEIFLKAFASVDSAGRVKVESVRPISFKLELDSDEEIKVGGISITITLF